MDAKDLHVGALLGEVRRASKTRCTVCRDDGGILGCSVSGCRSTFHVSCLNESGGFANYRYPYVIYCNRHLSKLGEYEIEPYNINQLQYSDWGGEGVPTDCGACERSIELKYFDVNTIRPSCCEQSERRWFHRACLQVHCNSYDYCPVCRDKSKFTQFAVNYGLLLKVGSIPSDLVYAQIGVDDGMQLEAPNAGGMNEEESSDMVEEDAQHEESNPIPAVPQNIDAAMDIAPAGPEVLLAIGVINSVSENTLFYNGLHVPQQSDGVDLVSELFSSLETAKIYKKDNPALIFEIIKGKEKPFLMEFSMHQYDKKSSEMCIKDLLQDGLLKRIVGEAEAE